MTTQDELAFVSFVRSYRQLFGQYGEIRLRRLKYRERRVARQVLGVGNAQENGRGEQLWYLKPGWEGRLERAGLDPVTCRLKDAEAFRRAWADAEGELYEKYLRRTAKARAKLMGEQTGPKGPRVKDLYARWRAEQKRLADEADSAD